MSVWDIRDDESDWNEGSAPSQHVNTWQRDHAVLEENPGSQKVSEDCGNKKPEASNYGGTDPVTARQRSGTNILLLLVENTRRESTTSAWFRWIIISTNIYIIR